MEKICEREGCGVVFICKPSEVKRGRKYCSKSCKAMVFGPPLRKGLVVPIDKATNTQLDRVAIARAAMESIRVIPIQPVVEEYISPELAKIRWNLKHNQSIAYDKITGQPIGNYNWDGSITEYQ